MAVDWEDVLNPGRAKPSAYADSFLTKVLIPLAAVCVGAIGLATSKEMPWWGVASLVAVLTILFGVICWPFVAGAFIRLRSSRAIRRVSKRCYPDLRQLIDRFEQQTSENYSQNAIYELRDFAHVRDVKGMPVFPGFYEFIKISEWVNFFARKAAKGKAADFLEIIKGVNLTASQYSQQCISLQNRLAAIYTDKLLDEPSLRKARQAWSAGREHANKLLSEWSAFCEQVRRETGEDVGGVHFAPLRALD